MSFTSYEPATPRLQRSELAVPASDVGMMEKAAKSDADYVFLDLEDAVVPADKPQARKNVIEALNDLDWSGKTISVRINGLDTHYMYRDVVDVIEQEADEDAKLLAGVGDERLSDSVRHVTGPRFAWLFVNLLTAILASAVIKYFDATIEHMVARAVLMPIVASMGGNAGTQTMTVTVRALAMRELGPANIARVVMRETAVGLINGFVFAMLLALVAYFWFGTDQLGAVIAVAMVVNLLAAALAGILIPLTLYRMGFDPAVASTVFVTTVTDVVGFFSFLGLATLWLM